LIDNYPPTARKGRREAAFFHGLVATGADGGLWIDSQRVTSPRVRQLMLPTRIEVDAARSSRILYEQLLFEIQDLCYQSSHSPD
jgi:hypothetical protein